MIIKNQILKDHCTNVKRDKVPGATLSCSKFFVVTMLLTKFIQSKNIRTRLTVMPLRNFFNFYSWKDKSAV